MQHWRVACGQLEVVDPHPWRRLSYLSTVPAIVIDLWDENRVVAVFPSLRSAELGKVMLQTISRVVRNVPAAELDAVFRRVAVREHGTADYAGLVESTRDRLIELAVLELQRDKASSKGAAPSYGELSRRWGWDI